MKAKIKNLNLRRFKNTSALHRAINNKIRAHAYKFKWFFHNTSRAYKLGYMFTSYTNYEKNSRLFFGE